MSGWVVITDVPVYKTGGSESRTIRFHNWNIKTEFSKETKIFEIFWESQKILDYRPGGNDPEGKRELSHFLFHFFGKLISLVK